MFFWKEIISRSKIREVTIVFHILCELPYHSRFIEFRTNSISYKASKVKKRTSGWICSSENCQYFTRLNHNWSCWYSSSHVGHISWPLLYISLVPVNLLLCYRNPSSQHLDPKYVVNELRSLVIFGFIIFNLFFFSYSNLLLQSQPSLFQLQHFLGFSSWLIFLMLLWLSFCLLVLFLQDSQLFI
jgi:hypothetical protein